MIPPLFFVIFRFVLFFPVTYLIYKYGQSIDFTKVFKPNSALAIRFLLMVMSVVFGYLFVDALVSLFEAINTMFS